MQLTRSGKSLGHLGYCSNIHPGESWDEVRRNLEQHVPGIRAALRPDGEFGIGLRLSALAARELAAPEVLAAFRQFLADERCYVFTINGFPYGPFHGTRVKEEVYLPDWQDAERLHYTNLLADIMVQLLPAGLGGSISTVPGAFKARVETDQSVRQMALRLVEHAVHLARLERATGKRIVLALEPEPCCFLETIADTVEFFGEHLFGHAAIDRMCRALGASRAEADELLRRHLTVCLDLCHAAIEFEDPDNCFEALEVAGITIGKLQISAGLRLENVTAESSTALEPFIDYVYLHQVVERRDGALRRFVDLPDALATLAEGPRWKERHDDSGSVNGQSGEHAGEREWRVHFHVPVFLDDLGAFASTQFFVRGALARHRLRPVSTHLEVETYTWDVLPERYRSEAVGDAIVRELQWVSDALGSD